jgi:hypothetical protein
MEPGWNWDLIWTAVGAVASAIGAGAIVFAVFQLRFDAWLKAQEVFTDEDFVNARAALFAHFDNAVDPWPLVSSEDAKKVCRKMDEMAHLRSFVGQERTLESWGIPIAKAWLLLQPTVEQERSRSHHPKKWEAFERLGLVAVAENDSLRAYRERILALQPPRVP